MKCAVLVQVLLVLLGVSWTCGQFLNNRPYPTYSLEHMPDTSFTCRAKVLGGYYADAETQCQMFHVCVKVPGLGVQDFRFLCPNGTAFDQESQICAEWDDVDCEAATLYYSSDNFDLYRLGSGFETAPFPGEDEATYHLQRSETGDARLSREKETIRVNQQTNYNTAVPPKRPQYNKERDILRGSSSSNFFNNKNGGKENDDDYEEAAPNQNNDIPKRKIIRKLNRKPEGTPVPQIPTTQAPKPSRPIGFVNNFAGSPFVPSTTGRTVSTTVALSNDQYTTAIQNYRGRQRGRGKDRQYNNAENFRNNERSNDNGQYRGQNQQVSSTPVYTNDEQYNRRPYSNQPSTQSTSAPFRQPESRQYRNFNRQSVQTEQAVSSTLAPKQQYNQYDTQRIRQQPAIQTTAVTNRQTVNQYKQTENYPSTTASFRQDYNRQTSQFNKKETENYPTGVPFTKQYDGQRIQQTQKQTENYSTDAPFTKQTVNNQFDVKKVQQTQKQTENYPSTTSFTNKQTSNNQFEGQKRPTTLKLTDNFPTTFSPNKQNKQTQFYQKQTDNYQSTPEIKQTNSQFDQYNTRQSSFNQQYTQTDYKQFDNTRNTNQQPTQYSTTSRPTTVHTQYTPTVPKQTTQYTYSTTPATRFSKPFDDTNYDDGTYSVKYDDDKYKPEDEFLKTAHSQNFASSRNEYTTNSKVNIPVPSKQSPRPFSVTTSVPNQTLAKQTPVVVPKTTNFDKTISPKPIEEKPLKAKKAKDVSYDYAYYDTNVGSEPDYDVGTEFARSTKKSN